MARLSLFVLLLAFSCVSCKPRKNEGVTTPTHVNLGAYPLRVGNVWAYDSGDTLTVVSDTVINGVNGVKIIKSNSHHRNVICCANQPDGLYLLAANSHTAFRSLINPAYNTYDTLRIAPVPVKFTNLPVLLGPEWNVNVPDMKNEMRHWVAYVSVTTPAGTFNCVKLTSNSYDEYYSEKGLVMKVDHVECLVPPCPDVVTKLVYTNF